MPRDALWATELALGSGAVCAALAWLEERSLTATNLRRLQLAAKQGRAWANLFRPVQAARRPSMAELRILLEAAEQPHCDRVTLTILKRRGGWASAPLTLDFANSPAGFDRTGSRSPDQPAVHCPGPDGVQG